MGSSPRHDQAYDPPEKGLPPPGSSAGVLRARRVIIAGPAGELLVYSPTIAPGNLIGSISGQLTTDGTSGNAVEQGIWSYQAPGIGEASALAGGALILAQGPVSGAGPWTQYFSAQAVGSQVQLNAQQNGTSVRITSGPPGGGGIQGGAGTFIDGQEYGGQTVFIPIGSTETYTNTTLATSANLQMTGLVLGGIYQFHLSVIYAGAATNGQLKWNVATDGTGTARQIYEGTTGAQVTNADQFPLSGHSANTIGTGIGNALGLDIDGILALTGVTNSVAMQFAQFAASATATTLFGGSYMRLWRIG